MKRIVVVTLNVDEDEDTTVVLECFKSTDLGQLNGGIVSIDVSNKKRPYDRVTWSADGTVKKRRRK